ncbi:LCP family protein [Streptomyces sp. NBC_01795]|uniref:LCP family protein n=1 Tax=unclassified Streptomyces TaxID=2593676 RepID=UPI002DD7F7D7|nr:MULTISPECIES: LCP family protein [unclassified Streptomyces]WSA92334.1 LCP family protein [Streptomyces sp. NBC_01795]WSS15010.1 LCP family protein [Streptomyces sp. NBC_01186]
MAGDSNDGDTAAERRARGIRASGRRRKPRSGRTRAMRAAAWTVAGAVVLGGGSLGFVYFKLDGNISGVDINAALGTNRPQDVPNGSMDILVMGSDSRAGDNAKYGKDQGGARSDTAMVVHINEKHDKASVISIPRDTLIQRPSCQGDESVGNKKVPAQRAMFNSAYEVGGPACAVKTVESISGVRMDHYLEVDFSGFKKLINTLGGVEMTTTKPIKDKDSHLNLKAGTHTLDGEQSLGLVRTRHGVGDGSDLGRIQLQQAFVKALMDQVNSIGLFSSPKKLYDLADTSTSAITTDSDLDSVSELTGMAKMLKGIKSDDIQMTTLPVDYDPNDPNRVIPLEAKTKKVWKALKADKPVPKSATKGSAGDQTDIGGVVKDKNGQKKTQGARN